MKFNVIQLDGGRWAVQARRRDRYFVDTVTTDKAEAVAMARFYSARWHIQQATALVKDARLPLPQLEELARMSQSFVYSYVERATDEDPDFDPEDSTGFLA